VAVAPQIWFGGIYIDEKPQNFFGQLSTDPQVWAIVHDDYTIPPDQLKTWQSERDSFVAGKQLIDRFHWTIGQRIQVRGTYIPGTIDLVLRGVISVDELDRAVSLGPAIGWAAAGPHLTYHLAAGEGGIRSFTQHLLASFESWWQQLAHWAQLDPEQQRALVQSIERAYKGKVEFLREARDRRLSAILRALEQARAPSGSESG